MIRSELLIACINDMIDAGHVMQSCTFEHPSGYTYSIKFKKIKKNSGNDKA
jgi:hypothetical protein